MEDINKEKKPIESIEINVLNQRLDILKKQIKELIIIVEEVKQKTVETNESPNKIQNYRNEFKEGISKYKNTSININPEVFFYFNAFIKFKGLKSIEAFSQALYQYVKSSDDFEEFEKIYFRDEDEI